MGFLDKIFFSNNKKTDNTINTSNTEYDIFAGNTVQSKMHMSNRLFWEGDILLNPILTDASRQYINKFGISINNIRPQYLNELYRSSPTHQQIVDYKVKLLSKDYIFEYKPSDDINLNKFKNVLIKKLNDFYNFDEFIENVTQDYVLQANVYFKITKINNVITNIEYIPSQRVRANTNRSLKITGYTINLDWTQMNGNSNKIKYKVYDHKLTDGEMILAYHKKLNDDFVYGTPNYFSAISWLELDANIPSFHSNNMINNIYPAGVITFYDFPQDPVQFKIWKKKLEALSDPDNNSKLMLNFSNDPERAPVLNSFPKNELSKEFFNMEESIKKGISSAHGFDPAILGIIAKAGKLGNNQEIETQTEDFKNNMDVYKKDITKIINKLIGICSYNFKFKYKNY